MHTKCVIEKVDNKVYTEIERKSWDYMSKFEREKEEWVYYLSVVENSILLTKV